MVIRPQKVLNQDDYIQEGIRLGSDVLILVCTIGDDYDHPKNRILLQKGGNWFEIRISGEACLSIDANKEGNAFVLGENGSVVQFDWKNPSTQDQLRASRSLVQNSAVITRGPLRQIRIVGTSVLCGGSVGQLYVLEQDQFRALPQMTINGVDGTIEDISGTSLKDIIVVTSDGFGAGFNGSVWYDLNLPTNVNLSSICSLSDGRYAIAGSRGMVMIGKYGQWYIVDPIDTERTYWGIATHDGIIYVAHLGGIDVVRDGQLVALQIPEANQLEFTALRGASDGVWSFAGQTVGVITANMWHTIMRRP